jgi:hypothetical protein
MTNSGPGLDPRGSSSLPEARTCRSPCGERTRPPNSSEPSMCRDMGEYRDGVMPYPRGSSESASPRPATPGLDARPGRPETAARTWLASKTTCTVRGAPTRRYGVITSPREVPGGDARGDTAAGAGVARDSHVGGLTPGGPSDGRWVMSSVSEPVPSPLVLALAEAIRGAGRNTNLVVDHAVAEGVAVLVPCACAVDVGDERLRPSRPAPASGRGRPRAARDDRRRRRRGPRAGRVRAPAEAAREILTRLGARPFSEWLDAVLDRASDRAARR